MAFAAACSNASYGEESRDAGVDAGSDTGATNPDSASSDADASTADVAGDSGVPLISNGGFEDPGGACGPTWELINANAVKAMPARSGANACKVCNIAGAGYFGLRVNPAPNGGPGGWTFEAYFRNAVDGVAADEAHLDFGWTTPDGGRTESPIAPLTGAYQPLQVVKQLGDDVSGVLGVQVAATGATGSCFLVDDVTLTVVPR